MELDDPDFKPAYNLKYKHKHPCKYCGTPVYRTDQWHKANHFSCHQCKLLRAKQYAENYYKTHKKKQ